MQGDQGLATIEEHCLNYLEKIKEINKEDKELSHRTHLENFLSGLCTHFAKANKTLDGLGVKHEPSNDKEGRGAPDFQVFKNDRTVGYIENKRVNADLDSIAKSEQIKKYLSLHHNIMLTDYLRFCLIRLEDGEPRIVGDHRICYHDQLSATIKQVKKATKAKQPNEDIKALTELFARFLSQEPEPLKSALDLAPLLASRTRLLRESLLSLESEGKIKQLHFTFENELYRRPSA